MSERKSNLSSTGKSHEFLQASVSAGGLLMNTNEATGDRSRFLRILLPINAKDDSRWGIQYAVRRQREGARLEVVLLHVGEPVTQWEVLRFRTEQEIAQFQSERAQAFIEEARQPLAAQDISWRGLFKQGELAFAILDTAEELECDEIVMPAATTWLPSLFSRAVAGAVARAQRGIPVVLVNAGGATINA
jgi:nucleotide-binding universal stress UspA family protein